MMNFKNGIELLRLCQTNQLPISEIMKIRECALAETTESELITRMKKVLEIMKHSAKTPIAHPHPSIGGLIGGEAQLVNEHRLAGKSLCGPLFSKAICYSLAVLESNSSMGLIVAAPTAGSSGVVPGVVLSLQEEYDLSDDALLPALFNASAIGYLAMRNATVSGAVGGCQAEVGIASAMAASAAVEIMGGTPKQCLDSASIALMNLLGLVCDPVGGLVECPCQIRNTIGATNALTAAELVLSGIKQMIPFDEMLETMYNIGRRMAPEFRETAKGGCAAAPSVCAACATPIL